MVWARRTLLAAALALSGCASAGAVQCTVGADCASGVCDADGTCAPPETSGAGDATSTSSGGGDGGAGSSTASAGQGGAGGTGAATSSGAGGESGVCAPNDDGVITREESPLAAGFHAKYEVALDALIDTAGTPAEGGGRTWDLTGALPGDHAVLAETQAIDDLWFAPTFPSATYATRLSDEEVLLGVFQITQTELLLLGVVSPDDGLDKTELVYDPPVKVLSFPLHEGDTFTTNATVTGYAQGIFSAFFEDYVSTVDAHGTMKTPFADFGVLRVRVELTRTVGVLVTKSRSYAFVAECFGTVASVRSQDGEASVEFTDAAEVRRLTP
jgi:hypothetical protein